MKKKEPFSAHCCVPEESLHPSFLILCPHTCNPLSVLSYVIYGSPLLSVTDYHTAEACNTTTCVFSKKKKKERKKERKRALWGRQEPAGTDGYFVWWTFQPSQVQPRDTGLFFPPPFLQGRLRTMHAPVEQIIGNLKCDNILSYHHKLPMIPLLQTLHLMLLPQW